MMSLPEFIHKLQRARPQQFITLIIKRARPQQFFTLIIKYFLPLLAAAVIGIISVSPLFIRTLI